MMESDSLKHGDRDENTVCKNICLDQGFADRVAKLCHSKYASLPKTGKPKKDLEWTMLSAVVFRRESTSELKVISLATGSKCIGVNKMSFNGDILNDSHAEVLARRGFLRYLYNQIHLLKKGSTSETLVETEDHKFGVRPDITFHLYCSHTPCGDASIFPKGTPQDDDVGACISGEAKRPCDDVGTESTPKRPKLEECLRLEKYQEAKECLTEEGGPHGYHYSADDIYRTGAKCVPSDTKQDEHLPGGGYHVVGVVRTKPGRGDPTLSVSCSDKIMRWNCVGLQGALLSLLLNKPVYLQSITIGGGCPYSPVAMKRALLDRVSSAAMLLPPEYRYALAAPVFLQSRIPFPDGRYASSAPQPCPSSLIWCNVPKRDLEVAVEGKKQGTTKKSQNSQAGRLLVCKVELQRQFELVSGDESTNAADNCTQNAGAVESISSKVTIGIKDGGYSSDIDENASHRRGENPCGDKPTDKHDKKCRAKYSELKERASEYRLTWKAIRSAAKLAWTEKNPALLDFFVDCDAERRNPRKVC